MANSTLNWLRGCIAFAVCLGIFGAIAFILTLLHTEDHPGENSHEFCFDALGTTQRGQPSTVVGRFGVDVEKHRICWDFFYQVLPGCTLSSVKLKGLVNEIDGLDASNTLATFVPHISNGVLGTSGRVNGSGQEHSACTHISAKNLRLLLKNPALNYIDVSLGGECVDNSFRDYITGLCHHPEFEMDIIDDDESHLEDDDDEHSHSGKHHGGGHHGDDDDSHGGKHHGGGHHDDDDVASESDSHNHGSVHHSDSDPEHQPTILHSKHGAAQFRRARHGGN